MTESPVLNVSMASLAMMAFGSAVLAAVGTYALFASPDRRLQWPTFQEPSQKIHSKGLKKAQRNSKRPADTQLPPKPLTRLPFLPDNTRECQDRREDPHDPSPRSGYLSWDEYFMSLAFLSAQRSKDPNKQVGAVIVGGNKVVLGIGYNGFPRGCADHALPWAKLPPRGSGNPLETKYPYVVHAEANALLNTNSASVNGAAVYVTMFPCNECAKLLIQAGIREIVYHEEKVGSEACSSGAAEQTHIVPSYQYTEPTSGAQGDFQPGADANGHAANQPCNLLDSACVALPGMASVQQEEAALADGNCQGAGASTLRAKSDSAQAMAGAAASYLASKRLLTMAGVTLRQHKLQRTVVLRGPP